MPNEFENPENFLQKYIEKFVDPKSAGATLTYHFFVNSVWVDYEYILLFSPESLIFSSDSPKV